MECPLLWESGVSAPSFRVSNIHLLQRRQTFLNRKRYGGLVVKTGSASCLLFSKDWFFEDVNKRIIEIEEDIKKHPDQVPSVIMISLAELKCGKIGIPKE